MKSSQNDPRHFTVGVKGWIEVTLADMPMNIAESLNDGGMIRGQWISRVNTIPWQRCLLRVTNRVVWKADGFLSCIFFRRMRSSSPHHQNSHIGRFTKQYVWGSQADTNMRSDTNWESNQSADVYYAASGKDPVWAKHSLYLTTKPSFGGFLKQGYTQIIHLNRIFWYKSSIWGCPHFRKPSILQGVNFEKASGCIEMPFLYPSSIIFPEKEL